MLTDIQQNVHNNVVTEQFNFGDNMDFRGHSRGTIREWHQFPGDFYLEAEGSYRFTINTLIELSTPSFTMQFGDVKLTSDEVDTVIDELTETVRKQTQTIDELTVDLRRGVINIKERLEFRQGRVDIDELYVDGRSINGFFHGYGYGGSLYGSISNINNGSQALNGAVRVLSEVVSVLAKGETVSPESIETLDALKENGVL